jgi:hypothetical protein
VRPREGQMEASSMSARFLTWSSSITKGPPFLWAGVRP